MGTNREDRYRRLRKGIGRAYAGGRRLSAGGRDRVVSGAGQVTKGLTWPARAVTGDELYQNELRWAAFISLFAITGVLLFLIDRLADRVDEEAQAVSVVKYYSDREAERGRREFAQEFVTKSMTTLSYYSKMHVAGADWWRHDTELDITQREQEFWNTRPWDMFPVSGPVMGPRIEESEGFDYWSMSRDPVRGSLDRIAVQRQIESLRKHRQESIETFNKAEDMLAEHSEPVTALTITGRYLYPVEQDADPEDLASFCDAELYSSQNTIIPRAISALMRLDGRVVCHGEADREELLAKAQSEAHSSMPSDSDRLDTLVIWLTELDWINAMRGSIDLGLIVWQHEDAWNKSKKSSKEIPSEVVCDLTALCGAIGGRFGVTHDQKAGDPLGFRPDLLGSIPKDKRPDERLRKNGALARLSLATDAHLDAQLVELIGGVLGSERGYQEAIGGYLAGLDYIYRIEKYGSTDHLNEYEEENNLGPHNMYANLRKEVGNVRDSFGEYLWRMDRLSEFIVERCANEMQERATQVTKSSYAQLMTWPEGIRFGLVGLILIWVAANFWEVRKSFLASRAERGDEDETLPAAAIESKSTRPEWMQEMEERLRGVVREELARNDD